MAKCPVMADEQMPALSGGRTRGGFGHPQPTPQGNPTCSPSIKPIPALADCSKLLCWLSDPRNWLRLGHPVPLFFGVRE